MALGLLFIMLVVMSLLGILGVVLLFWVKNPKASDVILILLTAYSLLIAFEGATSEPVNFVMMQVIHWLVGFVAVIGTAMRFMQKKQTVVSKVLVSISIFGGLYLLFFI